MVLVVVTDRLINNGRPISWKRLRKKEDYYVLSVTSLGHQRYAMVQAYHFGRPILILLPNQLGYAACSPHDIQAGNIFMVFRAERWRVYFNILKSKGEQKIQQPVIGKIGS